MIHAEGAEPDRFKRLLGLTVCQAVPVLRMTTNRITVGTLAKQAKCTDRRSGGGVRKKCRRGGSRCHGYGLGQCQAESVFALGVGCPLISYSEYCNSSWIGTHQHVGRRVGYVQSVFLTSQCKRTEFYRWFSPHLHFHSIRISRRRRQYGTFCRRADHQSPSPSSKHQRFQDHGSRKSRQRARAPTAMRASLGRLWCTSLRIPIANDCVLT